jgi:hypothetical protein
MVDRLYPLERKHFEAVVVPFIVRHRKGRVGPPSVGHYVCRRCVCGWIPRSIPPPRLWRFKKIRDHNLWAEAERTWHLHAHGH